MSLCWMHYGTYYSSSKSKKIVSTFTHTIFLPKKQSVTDFLPLGRTITPLCDKREQYDVIAMNNRIAFSWYSCQTYPEVNKASFKFKFAMNSAEYIYIYKDTPQSKSTKVATLDMIHSLTSIMDLIWYVPRAPVVYILSMVYSYS